MSCYEALAGSYDALTEEVGFGKRLDFSEKLMCRSRIPVKLVLDLACGTGTMSWLLTQRGYEVIGVDGSEDMLAAAMSKGGETQGVPPVPVHAEAGPVRHGGRGGVLSGQSQLLDGPKGRTADIPAAAPVCGPRRDAGVRREHRG